MLCIWTTSQIKLSLLQGKNIIHRPVRLARCPVIWRRTSCAQSVQNHWRGCPHVPLHPLLPPLNVECERRSTVCDQPHPENVKTLFPKINLVGKRFLHFVIHIKLASILLNIIQTANVQNKIPIKYQEYQSAFSTNFISTDSIVVVERKRSVAAALGSDLVPDESSFGCLESVLLHPSADPFNLWTGSTGAWPSSAPSGQGLEGHRVEDPGWQSVGSISYFHIRHTRPLYPKSICNTLGLSVPCDCVQWGALRSDCRKF